MQLCQKVNYFSTVLLYPEIASKRWANESVRIFLLAFLFSGRNVVLKDVLNDAILLLFSFECERREKATENNNRLLGSFTLRALSSFFPYVVTHRKSHFMGRAAAVNVHYIMGCGEWRTKEGRKEEDAHFTIEYLQFPLPRRRVTRERRRRVRKGEGEGVGYSKAFYLFSTCSWLSKRNSKFRES